MEPVEFNGICMLLNIACVIICIFTVKKNNKLDEEIQEIKMQHIALDMFKKITGK